MTPVFVEQFPCTELIRNTKVTDWNVVALNALEVKSSLSKFYVNAVHAIASWTIQRLENYQCVVIKRREKGKEMEKIESKKRKSTGPWSCKDKSAPCEVVLSHKSASAIEKRLLNGIFVDAEWDNVMWMKRKRDSSQQNQVNQWWILSTIPHIYPAPYTIVADSIDFIKFSVILWMS